MYNYSLFINSSEGSFTTTLLMYVDNIILAGNDKEEIDRVKESLNKTFKFKIKDFDDLRYFLGFEVAISKKGIMMNQRKYIGIVNRCRSFSLQTCSHSYG